MCPAGAAASLSAADATMTQRPAVVHRAGRRGQTGVCQDWINGHDLAKANRFTGADFETRDDLPLSPDSQPPV